MAGNRARIASLIRLAGLLLWLLLMICVSDDIRPIIYVPYVYLVKLIYFIFFLWCYRLWWNKDEYLKIFWILVLLISSPVFFHVTWLVHRNDKNKTHQQTDRNKWPASHAGKALREHKRRHTTTTYNLISRIIRCGASFVTTVEWTQVSN